MSFGNYRYAKILPDNYIFMSQGYKTVQSSYKLNLYTIDMWQISLYVECLNYTNSDLKFI